MTDFATAAAKHHTVWLSAPGWPATAHRYTIVDAYLVVLGDQRCPPTGTRVTATLHAIAAGPPVASRTSALQDFPSTRIDDRHLHELIGHRHLGHSSAEVTQALRRHRTNASFAALDTQ